MSVLQTDRCHLGKSDSIPHMPFPTKKCHCFLYLTSRLCFLSAFKQAHMWDIYFLMVYDHFSASSVDLLSYFLKIMVTLHCKKYFKGVPWANGFCLKHSACCPIYSAMHILETQFALSGVICFSKLFKLHSARI